MTCASYEHERTAAAEAALASLSDDERAEIDAHLEVLRKVPLPDKANGVRPYRGTLPDLPRGFEGPFWAKTDHFLVFHAVHPRECRVTLLWVLPQRSLELD